MGMAGIIMTYKEICRKLAKKNINIHFLGGENK